MKQHRFAPWGSVFEFPFPFPNELLHVGLRSAEFFYLLTEGAQLLFRQMEDAMAGDTTTVTGAENLGKLVQRKTQSECPLCKLDALNG
jgi:hypothetical protein